MKPLRMIFIEELRGKPYVMYRRSNIWRIYISEIINIVPIIMILQTPMSNPVNFDNTPRL